MRPNSNLPDIFQAEFPALDPALLAALLTDIQLDALGNSVDPSDDQIEALRITLKELSAQAEQDERCQDRTEDDFYVPLSATEDDTLYSLSGANANSYTPVSGSSASSSVASATSSIPQSFDTPLGFLQAALPHISTSRLRDALADVGYYEGSSGEDPDVDMEAAIDHILTSEYIRELEERGLESEDDKIDTQSPWKTVGSKKRPNGLHKRHRQKSNTISIADIRQQHQLPPRSRNVTPTLKGAPDPWTQLASLSSHLATVIPEQSSFFFSSYFHNPKYSAPADALRAAFTAINTYIFTDSSDAFSNLLEIIKGSSVYGDLSSSQRVQLMQDIRLCLQATQGRADDAHDLIWLLQDLDNDFLGPLEMGVYHSPVHEVSPWAPPLQSSSSLSSGPPPVTPPPISTATVRPVTSQTTGSSPRAWQQVPLRKSPNTVHPLLGCIPAYASKDAKADFQKRWPMRRTASDNIRRRDELLKQATKAWTGSNKTNRGGEIALYYAQQARECQEVARKEMLEDARRTIEARRLCSPDRNTVDLHGTTVAEAVEIVTDILQKEGTSTSKPLTIITGRGIHSVNQIGVLKPAVRAALLKDGWNISSWDGGLIVRGKNQI